MSDPANGALPRERAASLLAFTPSPAIELVVDERHRLIYRIIFYIEWYSMKVVNSLIENSLAVIELLAHEARSMRLSEIASSLQLQPSGTHRMLATLTALGWVEQDPVTEFYRLSLKLAAIGHRYLQASQLPDICQPILDRLAEETRELVRLAVLANGKLTTIAAAQGARGSLICQSRVFPVLPLHVTASGKAWLSSLPREDALKLVLSAGLGEPGEFGPNALRSVDALIKELDRVRARGYGTAIEEAEPGVSSVAVIIRPDAGEAVGALAVVAPAFRVSKKRIPEIAQVTIKAAAELSLVWPLRSLVHSHEMRVTRTAS